MNRATVLGLLLLAVLGAGLAFTLRPAFRPDVLPGPLALPESLAAETEAPPLDALPGVLAWTAAACFALLWRRGVGQSPLVALLPGLVLLLHPALAVAAATEAGRLDLFVLAALLLGAWLTTVEWSGWVAAGVLLLFLAVPAAPSGAVFAALSAFVLVERRPAMVRGAWLVLVFGAARAFGLPGLPELLDPSVTAPPVAVDGLGWSDLLMGAAAAHVPTGSVPFVPASGPPAVALVLVGLLLAATLVVPPERRFGGRFLGPLGAIALALAAAAARHGGALPPSAVAPLVILLAVWVAALGDDVEPRPSRRIAFVALAGALLVGLGTAGVRAFSQLAERRAFFAAAGPADAGRADQDPRARAALRAELPDEPAARRFERVDRRLEAAPAEGATAAAIDRDLAIAAALAGSPERAAPLLARAVDGATRAGDGELAARAWLDLLDVHLRESRPELALERIEARGTIEEAELAAETLCREGLAWFLVAFQPQADGRLPSVDVRDRALTRARRAFEQAVERAPHRPRPRLERGRFELALGRPIEAVKELEACAEASPELAAPHLELARLYFTLGEDSDGERELAAARARAGRSDPEVRLVTAQLRVARGDLLGAVEMAESLKAEVHRLRGARGALGELYRILARAAEDQRNLGLAEGMAENALDLARDRDGDTTMRLARVLRTQRKFEEAVEVLERAATEGIPVADLEAEIALAYKNAGYAHLLRAERRQALDDFLAALDRSRDVTALGAVPKLVRELIDEFEGDVDPALATDEARRRYEQGVAAYGEGDDALAEASLVASLALLPRNPYAHYQLGLVWIRQGRTADARVELEQALKTGEALGRRDVVESAKRELERLDAEG